MGDLRLNGSTSGAITLSPPAVAGTNTITLPATTGTMLVATGGFLPVNQGGTGLTSTGSVGNVLFTTDGSTFTATQKIVAGTTVASTSGTSIDFTSIPSWVKRITVMFNGTNLSGSSEYQIRIGSGSITSTGYVSSSAYVRASLAGLFVSSTTGFVIQTGSATTNGSMVLNLLGSNLWVASHFVGQSAGGCVGGGALTLSGVLDRVRITSTNGTDTFTSGSINLLWE